MKLERITLRQIRMPLVHFFETSFSRTYGRDIILVEAVAEGISGWGEVTAGEAGVRDGNSRGMSSLPGYRSASRPRWSHPADDVTSRDLTAGHPARACASVRHP